MRFLGPLITQLCRVSVASVLFAGAAYADCFTLDVDGAPLGSPEWEVCVSSHHDLKRAFRKSYNLQIHRLDGAGTSVNESNLSKNELVSILKPGHPEIVDELLHGRAKQLFVTASPGNSVVMNVAGEEGPAPAPVPPGSTEVTSAPCASTDAPASVGVPGLGEILARASSPSDRDPSGLPMVALDKVSTWLEAHSSHSNGQAQIAGLDFDENGPRQGCRASDLRYTAELFRAKGVPTWLSTIFADESHCDPNAYNPVSHAAGYCQFTERTAASMGLLKCSRWVTKDFCARGAITEDRRSDPVACQDAAVVLLQGNYAQIERDCHATSWTAALAAYNIGSGNLERKFCYSPTDNTLFSAPNAGKGTQKGTLQDETWNYIRRIASMSLLIDERLDSDPAFAARFHGDINYDIGLDYAPTRSLSSSSR